MIKHFAFLLLFILSSFYLSSQNYVPMAVDSATWFMGSTDENPELDVIVVLRLEGDTVVNNMTYSKIYHYEYQNGILLFTRKLLGLLRDDISERKVYGGVFHDMQNDFGTFLNEYEYQCNWGDENSFNEDLLYDFNVEQGDTLSSCMFPDQNIITSIDSLELYGYKRRSLAIEDNDFKNLTEGIGTCIGIFRGQECFLTGGGYSYYLFNYCIGPFENCNLLTSTKEVNSENKINISPNPVSDILYISEESDFIKFSVMDVHGQVIESFDRLNRIDMSNYSSGIYILKAMDISGKVYIQKVVKN